MKELTSWLQQLVIELRLDEVVQTLNRLFTVAKPDYETALIILEANRKRLDKRRRSGIISDEAYNLELNSIIEKLLDFIEDIKRDYNSYSPYISGTSVLNVDEEKEVILFVGANPAKFEEIDIRRETNLISERLSLLGKRELFEFKVVLDINPLDFQRNLLKFEKAPRFVHFAGNALIDDPTYGTGIVFAGKSPDEIQMVNGALLGSLFRTFNTVECVFLNACNTLPFGIEIIKHLPFVVAMSQYTTDRFAIDFAASFYEAIGAGKDIEFAFDYSINAMYLQGIYKQEQIETPRLLKKGNAYDFVWNGETIDEWYDRVRPV